jgi:hypothetical protein
MTQWFIMGGEMINAQRVKNSNRKGFVMGSKEFTSCHELTFYSPAGEYLIRNQFE